MDSFLPPSFPRPFPPSYLLHSLYLAACSYTAFINLLSLIPLIVRPLLVSPSVLSPRSHFPCSLALHLDFISWVQHEGLNLDPLRTWRGLYCFTDFVLRPFIYIHGTGNSSPPLYAVHSLPFHSPCTQSCYSNMRALLPHVTEHFHWRWQTCMAPRV